MNLRQRSDHKDKPFALRLQPAHLEVIPEPDAIKEAIEDEKSSSASVDSGHKKRLEEVVPELPLDVSFIQDKSKLIPRLRWEDSSYSSGSPLRIRNEIKIVEIDEDESDQEYIEYSAKKD